MFVWNLLVGWPLLDPVVVWIPGTCGFICDHDVVDQMAKNALDLPNVCRVIFPNLKDATDLLEIHHHTLGISEAKSSLLQLVDPTRICFRMVKTKVKGFYLEKKM
jgi:hypothetical protein